jgi:ATP-grasp domain-containing protein
MIILFPSNPLNPKSVDNSFGYEARAAKEAGFRIGRVDLEIILGGEVKLSDMNTGYNDIIYRGWLMKPEHYERLAAELPGRLITSPADYQAAYNFPIWYHKVEQHTPNTLIITRESVESDFNGKLDTIAAQVKDHFGDKPCFVKDYLKSAKHRWFDACYIPSAQDTEEVKRIISNFLDIVSVNLTGGLCIREFITFKQIGIHSKIHSPLINEWRAFLHYGKVFYLCPYWAEGDYSGNKPEVSMIEEMAIGLQHLPFIALDVAEADDKWMIIEVNDGGGSGVPECGDVKEFYMKLAERFIQ